MVEMHPVIIDVFAIKLEMTKSTHTHTHTHTYTHTHKHTHTHTHTHIYIYIYIYILDLDANVYNISVCMNTNKWKVRYVVQSLEIPPLITCQGFHLSGRDSPVCKRHWQQVSTCGFKTRYDWYYYHLLLLLLYLVFLMIALIAYNPAF